MACKIMVGEEFEGTKKANAALLHQSNRRKTKEKPSGRKQPRKKDFDNDTTRKGLVNFKQKPVTKRAFSNDSDGDDDDFVHEMPKQKCRRKELCSMSDESSDENDKASPMREKSQTIIRLKSLDIMNRCSHKKFVNDEEMSQELTKDHYPCTSYTAKNLHKRASNVKTNRAFLYSDTKEVLFEWDDFLERVAGTYPDSLLCNHVYAELMFMRR